MRPRRSRWGDVVKEHRAAEPGWESRPCRFLAQCSLHMTLIYPSHQTQAHSGPPESLPHPQSAGFIYSGAGGHRGFGESSR